MPITGGSSDKLGNAYEGLWVRDQLLRILNGEAQRLVLESIDEIESRGVEFRVETKDSAEYWSVKRQKAKAAAWSIADLVRPDKNGRSILGDLLAHAERSEGNRAVFASTMAAGQLAELKQYARKEEGFRARLGRSQELESNFKRLQTFCGGDETRARRFLQRLTLRTVDEGRLRDETEFKVRSLLRHVNGGAIDLARALHVLASYAELNPHIEIERPSLASFLSENELVPRERATEALTQKVAELRDRFERRLQGQIVGGELLLLPKSAPLLDSQSRPLAAKILVVAEAGAGKSCLLLQTMRELTSTGVPVMPISMDSVPADVSHAHELGVKWGLPDSPVVALSLLADESGCGVLLIDQLDAVSTASGRRTELWDLFDQLVHQVAARPGLNLIVGCRAFDLEHDHRLRRLRSKDADVYEVRVHALPDDQVTAQLTAHGVDVSTLPVSTRTLLRLPLHLALYISLPPARRLGLRSREALFGEFWLVKQQEADKRVGGESAWTRVLDLLLARLSSSQALSAPADLLDDHALYARAMTSARVLVLDDGKYRFFHETFFDYCFARRFAARGEHLVPFLRTREQHLFCRAQVRQVLAYLRGTDRDAYQKELNAVLLATDVRAHIKVMILDWLGGVDAPDQSERGAVRALLDGFPKTKQTVDALLRQAAWFDLADAAGEIEGELASPDADIQDHAVEILGAPSILEARGDRVAELLEQYRKSDAEWARRLWWIFRNARSRYGAGLSALFLKLIDEDVLWSIAPDDESRGGRVAGWWRHLSVVVDDSPELASMAVGRWLTKLVIRVGAIESARVRSRLLRRELGYDRGAAAALIDLARAMPMEFFGAVLPPLIDLVLKSLRLEEDRLARDAVGDGRAVDEHPLTVAEGLFEGLVTAFGALPETDRIAQAALLARLSDTASDSFAYLLLRMWTSRPTEYADQIVDFLVRDPHRLRVGYTVSGGGGDAGSVVSRDAISAATPHCAPESLARLMESILGFAPRFEREHPSSRGHSELDLLEAIPPELRSARVTSRLQELHRKFTHWSAAPPEPLRSHSPESPIDPAACERMTDQQWLNALEKHSRPDSDAAVSFGNEGSRFALSKILRDATKSDPVRFCRLIVHLSRNVLPHYVTAVVETIWQSAGEPVSVSTDDLVRLLEFAHDLPDRPCGISVCRLIGGHAVRPWPHEIFQIVGCYATHESPPEDDRDESGESDESHGDDSDPDREEELLFAARNTLRGEAAEAIASLLQEAPARWTELSPYARSLASDRTLGVRCSATAIVLAIAESLPDEAELLFHTVIDTDDAIFRAELVQRCVRYFAFKSSPRVPEVIQRMLRSANASVQRFGAITVCLTYLDGTTTLEKMRSVLEGSEPIRVGAAMVFARNLDDADLRTTCLQRVLPFFNDPSQRVRDRAGEALRFLHVLRTDEQETLLRALTTSTLSTSRLEEIVQYLGDSLAALPALTAEVLEHALLALERDAADIRSSAYLTAESIAKLVFRLYADTSSEEVRTRCLSMIDRMTLASFSGVTDGLAAHDR